MTTEATVLEAAVAPAAAPTVAETKPDAAPAPQAAPAPAADTPTFDWRKEIAGDDGKLLKNLERYSDLKALHKSLDDTQKALRDSGRVKIPGADATEDDMKAFAKAMGIPEKPDGYKITPKLPDGVELTDEYKAQIEQVTAFLHQRGGTAAAPATVQAAADLLIEMQENAQAAIIANGEKAHKETTAKLKQEWGQDFKNNIGYAQAAVQGLFEKEIASDLLNMRLEDGTKLGDYAPFLRAMATAGRQLAQDPLFIPTNQLQGDPKSLDERKREIMSWRTGTPDQQRLYARADIQQELDTINAKQIAAMQGRAA